MMTEISLYGNSRCEKLGTPFEMGSVPRGCIRCWGQPYRPGASSISDCSGPCGMSMDSSPVRSSRNTNRAT